MPDYWVVIFFLGWDRDRGLSDVEFKLEVEVAHSTQLSVSKTKDLKEQKIRSRQ